nr:Chain P, THE NAKED PEPTIDE APDTRP [Homo sapiens]5A2K_P Chain P, ANTIGEN TN, THR IS COVALENTLY BOUND TO GALNAC [Homo sapiens]5FXC_P Chain P, GLYCOPEPTIDE [Mus musculus]6FZQ_P Chain P, Mucin-1 [Homo sapiens]6FZR_P Chain P, Mucin-1 [Homo sapiens]6TGG_P Chain P, Mucin-1 [Homo sapiens]
APDTRP